MGVVIPTRGVAEISCLLGCSQAVRHQILILLFRWFESSYPSQLGGVSVPWKETMVELFAEDWVVIKCEQASV